MSDLTQERLKNLLDYNPKTGLFRWRVLRGGTASAESVAGVLHPTGYRRIQVDGKRYAAHRLAWLYVHGRWPEGQIDHINGVRDANGIENLRIAKNDAEQQQNRSLHPFNTSGFPGVWWKKGAEKWTAYIRYKNKRHYLGVFDDIEEAAEAYREAKARLHTFNPETRDFSYE